jgi:tripartite ATP-independent transporter DctP family solute receptor
LEETTMTRSLTRRTALKFAGVAGGLLGFPHVLRAQALKPEYKLSVVGNRPLGTTEAAFRWAELVTERTQGRINIRVYPGSQLLGGDQTREFVAMRQGVIDMNVASTINLAPQIREMNLFSLPFIMPDHKAFDALTSGAVRSDLDAILGTRDAVSLAWSENGFRQVSNSKRPVHKPEDLKGLKIRYAAGQIYADIFNALGANPLQMSWADLQPALATGAVDGQETPVNVFLQSQLDRVAQRNLTLWNYVADANIFLVSKAVWGSFAPADHEILRAAAQQAAQEHTVSSRKGVVGADRSSFDELKKRNVEVVELSAADQAVFQKTTRPVFDKWAQTVGTELVKKAEAAVAKRGA